MRKRGMIIRMKGLEKIPGFYSSVYQVACAVNTSSPQQPQAQHRPRPAPEDTDRIGA